MKYVAEFSNAKIAPEAPQGLEGGEEAEIIGEVCEEPSRRVIMYTQFGSTHMTDVPVGAPLPRTC